MARNTRAKRRSPQLMSMHHQRAVEPRNRRALRQRLEGLLDGAPDDLAMRVARAATLSGPEAQRILDMATQNDTAVSQDKLAEARKLIEEHSVAP